MSRATGLVATLMVAFAFSTSGSEARASSLVTGVSYVTESDPLAFERVKQSGSTFVHTWLRWNEVAPDSEPVHWDPTDPDDPNYDWGRVDAWVIGAVNAGLVPLLQVYYAPVWAQRCRTNSDLPTSPPCNPDPAAMADFGKAAARRYSGSRPGLPKVRYWQPQNEPNLSLFFNPQFDKNGVPVSPRLYRNLLNQFYAAVKSVDPKNIVISAGLAPNARRGSAVGPLDFTRRLLCMKGRKNPMPTKENCGGGVHLDVFDMHPYTSGGPTHVSYGKDDVQLSDLPELKRLIAAADRAGRIKNESRRTPLWVTEFSWDSKAPDPGGVPMGILRRWVSEALYRSWQAGIPKFFWYSLRDQDPGKLPWSYTAQSGLYFRGPSLVKDRPKPILKAFRFPFAAFASQRKGRPGFEYWGRTPDSSAGKVRIEVLKAGNSQRKRSVRANSAGIFKGWIPLSGNRRRFSVRAVRSGERSFPFSLREVKDFFQPPFG